MHLHYSQNTLGVIHVSSGREVDDVVDELLGGEPFYEGGGDEGFPRPGLANHHQWQLLLDAQVQKIFLQKKQGLKSTCSALKGYQDIFSILS